MIKTVLQLLPTERGQNIGVLLNDSALRDAVKEFAQSFEGTFADMRQCNFKRLPYGGEYFESIIIDDATLLEDQQVVLELKKALQKNRYLIVLSNDIDRWSMAERLEQFGFSGFNTIEESPCNIHIMKKWFTL